MAKHASGRDQLRAAIERSTTARQTFEEGVQDELDNAGAWLATVAEQLKADGCQIRRFQNDSFGQPLGAVAAGWCAVFPNTCVYLAVWEQDPTLTSDRSDHANTVMPASNAVGRYDLQIPRTVDSMSRRTVTHIGVYDGEATIEQWTWSLIVDTDPMEYRWAAFPDGYWDGKPDEIEELADLDGLQGKLDELIRRFVETASRSAPGDGA